MQQSGPLDALPLPGIYLIITMVALLAVELGFRLARNRLLRSPRESEERGAGRCDRRSYPGTAGFPARIYVRLGG